MTNGFRSPVAGGGEIVSPAVKYNYVNLHVELNHGSQISYYYSERDACNADIENNERCFIDPNVQLRTVLLTV